MWQQLETDPSHPLAPILDSLRYPLFTAWEKAVQGFSFERYIVLGTGGASLGGQTLASLVVKGPITFLENIDPQTIERYLKEINFHTTGFIVISKSGQTSETLAQFVVFYQAAKKILAEKASHHFLVITTPHASALKQMATDLCLRCVDHPAQVGGRFSAFTAVGMVPALLAGLPLKDFFKGALSVLEDPTEALLGAAFAYHHSQGLRPIHVMMVYSDLLGVWALWFRQLWAESLGKEGQGLTPLIALGTVDQHSQLQLFAQGPDDKVYTFIGIDTRGKGPSLSFKETDSQAFAYLQRKTLGDLFEAEQRATYHSLVNGHRPARFLTVGALDAYHLGILMTHFILETVLLAALMGIDAFSQEGVEESKRLTKAYLMDPHP